MNSKPDDKIAGQVRTMKLVYSAMAVVQAIFGGVVYGLIKGGMMGKPDYNFAITLQKVLLFAIPGLMAAGYFVFRFLLSKIEKNLSLEDKVKRYFSLVLVRAGLFEGAFFLCAVTALITGVELFLWIAPVLFLVFLLMRPTAAGMAVDLELSPADRSRLGE